jgi:DNA-binding GntR family transcriptional regulator
LFNNSSIESWDQLLIEQGCNLSVMRANMVEDFADDRRQLSRTSTVEWVVDSLRTRITEGYFSPGTRLSEEALGEALEVSRNTLREAFRLLTHERLLEHRRNRGVFVRSLSMEDVAELYRIRGLLEGAALGAATPESSLAELQAAVEEGEAAAERADWQAAGTANIHFHQAVVALAGSPRLTDYLRGLFAELRLAFLVVDDPRRLHEPYIPRNRSLLTLLEKGDAAAAQRELAGYLELAQQELIAASQEAAR